ncbi:MAG: flagellar FliJ family protein [Planctomycetota bacterium]
MSGRNMRKLVRLLEIRRYQEAASRQEFGIAVRKEQEAEDRCERGKGVMNGAHDGFRQQVGAGRVTVEALRSVARQVRFCERQWEMLKLQFEKKQEQRIRARQEYQEARRKSLSLERLEERRAEAEAVGLRRAEQKSADEVALRRFAETTARVRASGEGGMMEDSDE